MNLINQTCILHHRPTYVVFLGFFLLIELLYFQTAVSYLYVYLLWENGCVRKRLWEAWFVPSICILYARSSGLASTSDLICIFSLNSAAHAVCCTFLLWCQNGWITRQQPPSCTEGVLVPGGCCSLAQPDWSHFEGQVIQVTVFSSIIFLTSAC